MSNSQHFEIDEEHQVTHVTLIDPKLFDTLLVTELQDELLDYLLTHQPQNVIIDFERVTHCSTAVINGLLNAKKRVVDYGGVLKLCGMIGPIRDAYKMLNLDGTVFEIYDSFVDAAEACA